ncbi:YoaK family protein [Streptomyces sp. NPDC046985]|uniref:YoaK family protein n=1 Tax=Streptomyces sp. NPDC046985 TaxID=3155377 RepID=UPI0033D1D191
MTADPQPDDRADDDPEARGLRLVAVLLGLTVVSGLIDAVCYIGLGHVFTANMTGNIVILGFAAAGAPDFSVGHAATSLACFVAGAVAGGRVAGRYGGGSRRAWARATLAVEAVIVAVAAAVAYAVPLTGGTVYALISLTAFAMGLRNASVGKLGVADLKTTVLTTTLTTLVAESWLAGGTGQRAPRRRAAIVALPAGAALGAWLVLHGDLGTPLLLAALASAALAAVTSGRD